MTNRIKELRKARGWTVAQLAEKVNLSTTHISNLENHKRGLEISWLEPFAAAFDVSPIDLLEGDWNSMPPELIGARPLTNDEMEVELLKAFRSMNTITKARLLLEVHDLMDKNNSIE